MGLDDLTTGNYDGVYGAWSSGNGSSGSGDGGGSNGPVTVTPSNPGAAIDAGRNARPALPGGMTVGVGTTSGSSSINLETARKIADFVSVSTALVGVALTVTGVGAPVAAGLFLFSGVASLTSVAITSYSYRQGEATMTDVINLAGENFVGYIY